MLLSDCLRNCKRSAQAAHRRTCTSPRHRATFRRDLESLETRCLFSSAFVQSNLVTDDQSFTRAQVQDTNLVNPWGLAAAPGKEWWLANEGTGTSTLYDTPTSPVSVETLVVNIPANPDGGLLAVHNSSTGIVYHDPSTGGFNVSETVNGVTKSGSSAFLFATIDGTISGWSPGVDRTNAIIGAHTNNAAYTGLAIATDPAGVTRLYAANFAGGIDVYDQTFTPVTLAGSFSDPNLPGDYTPFNVQAINNKLYVEYAPVDKVLGGQQARGDGAVDIYNLNGTLQQRLVLPGDTSINDPWAIAKAPANFGSFSNDLIVGNFGDGTISAFNPNSGKFVGGMHDTTGHPIAIPHLWGLAFGNGGQAGPTNTLYFTAGLSSHLAPSNVPFHGLFGSLTVSRTGQEFDSAPIKSSLTMPGAGMSGLLATSNSNLDALQMTLIDRLDAL